MFTQYLRVNRGRADAKALGHMHAKPQAIEIGTAAHNTIVLRKAARNAAKASVSGSVELSSVRLAGAAATIRGTMPYNFGICSKKPQPTQGIISVDRAAGFLVDTGGDHDKGCSRNILVIPVANIDCWRQRRAVAQIDRHRLRRQRVLSTRTISRAVPRITRAYAHAAPTLPAPMIPIFIGGCRLDDKVVHKRRLFVDSEPSVGASACAIFIARTWIASISYRRTTCLDRHQNLEATAPAPREQNIDADHSAGVRRGPTSHYGGGYCARG